MPVDNREFINALEILARDRNIRVTVKESLKGGLITGICATAGGVCGGPAGLAIGGILGALGAGYYGASRYKPFVTILREMSPDEQQALVDSIRNALKDIRPEDALLLAPLLLQNGNVQQLAIKALASYLESEMRMQVII